jgi:predicted O-methyltransferase YrrM
MSGDLIPVTWERVDRYFVEALVAEDAALTAALADSSAAGLPAIAVAPNQGALLHLLALSMGAKRILEIGTLGGYSTIWLARALPADGRLITLEYEPRHAQVATANIARAGLADRVQVMTGAALDSLAALSAAGEPPFDLVFIDADKANIPGYFEWALRLTHPGSILIVDNVVRDGKVIEAASPEENVQGVRRFIAAISGDARVTATAIQTVGSKGYDGFLIARVNTPA